jgi:hypothetical protein
MFEDLINDISSRLGIAISGTVHSANIEIFQKDQIGSFALLQTLASSTGHVIFYNGSKILIEDVVQLLQKSVDKTLTSNLLDIKAQNTKFVKNIKIEWIEKVKNGLNLEDKNMSLTRGLISTGEELIVPKIYKDSQMQISRLQYIYNKQKIEANFPLDTDVELFDKIEVEDNGTNYKFLTLSKNYNFNNMTLTVKGFGDVIY